MPNGNQIEVDVRADTSQARAAVQQLGQDLQRLKQQMAAPGAPGSGLLTPLPPGLGGPPGQPGQSLLARATAAAQAGGGGGGGARFPLADVTTSGEAAARSWAGFESVLARVATRLIAVKVILDSIRMVGEVITEAIHWEAMTARFESLTRSGATARDQLKAFQTAARETGQSEEAFRQIDLSLQAVGEDAGDAAQEALTLGKYAEFSGEKGLQLAKAFHDVKLGVGTLQEMRQLVSLEGEFGETTMQAINEIERQHNALKREQEDLTLIEAIENRNYELIRRQADETLRAQEAVTGFGDSLGLGNAMVKQMGQGLAATGAQMHIIRGGVEVGTANLGAVSAVMAPLLRAGEQRLAQETGIGMASLRTLEKYGLISSSELMGAQRRSQEDQRRKQEFQHQDTQQNRHISMLQQEHDLIVQQRDLEPQVTKEIENQNNLLKLQTGQLKTIEGQTERIKQNLTLRPEQISPEAQKMHEAQRAIQRSVAPMPSWGPAQPSAAATPAASTEAGLLQQAVALLGKIHAFNEKTFA